MVKTSLKWSLLCVCLIGIAGTQANAQRGAGGMGRGGQGRGGAGYGMSEDRPCLALNAISDGTSGDQEVATLSDEAAKGILTMREDEKLAHDVYVTLGEKWQVPAFTNIAGAETRHMNAMAMLIKKYGLTDPVTDTTVGKFQTPAVATLYEKLVADGSESLVAAYKVGAYIEDLDIADLREARANAKQPDIQAVYKNLERASRNHLRSFASNLKSADAKYVAQHLSQEDFDAIASSEWERGGPQGMRGRGAGQGRGRGQAAGSGQGFRQGQGNGGGRGQGRGRGRGQGRGNGYGGGRW